MKKVYLILFSVLCASLNAQYTMILDPNGNGGFETGATFASNNWVVANSPVNQWHLGTAATGYSGARAAYISNNSGISNLYSTNSGTNSHLYRDVDLTAFTPASSITLTFRWKSYLNDGTWDTYRLFRMTTAQTPVAGAISPGTQIGLSNYYLQNTWQTATVSLTGQGGTIIRLNWTFRTGTTAGTQPPPALDDVHIYEGVFVLPVDFYSYSASLISNNDVHVQWVTASENNNNYFVVEKSADLHQWEQVQIVPGSGASNTMKNYEITDSKAMLGVSYYRIKQVDFNGKSTYSPIEVIKNNSNSLINVYPNPCINQVTINFSEVSEASQIAICNSNGVYYFKQLVNKEENKEKIEIQTKDWPAGEYILFILPSNEEKAKSIKFIKTID